MISRAIGWCFSWPREALARALLGLGLHPNHVTVLGMLCTVAAGVAVAAGPDHWRSGAVVLLVAAGACDLLDGSMAKLGNLHTRFGAVLDSVCDRVGDAALYLGPMAYVAAGPAGEAAGRDANLTLLTLAGAGLVWAYLVSYIRARAADEGARAGGGFWQRPERVVTLLLGLAFHHLATALWILGLLPLTTVAHRLWKARRGCDPARGAAAAWPGAEDPRGVLGVVLWRWGRGTIPFDLYAGAVVLVLVFVDVPAVDPLRDLLARLVAA